MRSSRRQHRSKQNIISWKPLMKQYYLNLTTVHAEITTQMYTLHTSELYSDRNTSPRQQLSFPPAPPSEPNYPVSCRTRTLLLVLSSKLPSPVISLPSYALSTGSGPGSLNASNTSSSHLPIKFSQLPNLHTFITLSPFKGFAIYFICRYSCLVTFIILSKITDRSFRYASLCLDHYTHRIQAPLSQA